MARLLALLSILGCGVALAHHSFAVFFDTDSQLRKVTGVVREFRFSNPHGVVTLAVKQGGREIIWRAETNSPSILRRRGWTAQSLHNGEAVGTQPTPVKE
jgi:N-acyl-L-homoserine lactone synthetase